MTEDDSEQDKTGLLVRRMLGKYDGLTVSDLVEGKIKPYDLQPLLMKAFENIVAGMRAGDVFGRYRSSDLLKPSGVSQKEMVALDALIYGLVPNHFESIELSPVCPLGINGTLTMTNQKKILSTIRNTEVNADPTTALAMESAKRRAECLSSAGRKDEKISLCTSHRSLRLQKFQEDSGFLQHFRTFAACTAGKDSGDKTFETDCLAEHIDLYLSLLEILCRSSYSARGITVRISDIRITEKIIGITGRDRNELAQNTQTRDFKPFADCDILLPETVASLAQVEAELVEEYGIGTQMRFLERAQREVTDKLQARYPEVRFEFDLHRIAGIGYYENLCFKITATNDAGTEYPLADGGMTDWTQKLLKSKKERLFIGGFGSELFCGNFKKA